MFKVSPIGTKEPIANSLQLQVVVNPPQYWQFIRFSKPLPIWKSSEIFEKEKKCILWSHLFFIFS